MFVKTIKVAAAVMAITKCLISAPTVNRFTGTARALRQRRTRPGDWMVRAGLMEKIMSKTNDTSYDVAATSERELTEAELETVSGGFLGRLVAMSLREDHKQNRAADTFNQYLQGAR